MESCVGNKRSRETSPEESPEAKRLHADLIYGILEEDDVDAGDRDPASLDLATVMKSLEEEIAMPPEENGEAIQVEIGYLLEASDDDLGLPPPPLPATELWTEEEVEPAEGFGQIWGFEEEEMAVWYEGLMESGVPAETFGLADDDVAPSAADGVIFDSSDFYWRPESLPAQ
ncbi:hypothetical protein IEQ34_006805 [Dendrobium chrysotoxum]|uniref:Uncharacterized protein n=1 Tax=Dendrobium chrysotoxum TaxID=161865 RepID=A0AAV7H7I0_DENCH|nr:hypothetical protein IEQ34_006805 [Dendrobium chrysotoxum]